MRAIFLCDSFILLDFLVFANSLETQKEASRRGSCFSAFTSPCWPSSSPSSQEWETPADHMKSPQYPTRKPTLCWPPRSTSSQTRGRARRWRRCFTSSCWPPSCGTVSTAPSWCCCSAACTAACRPTGPHSVTLLGGVRILVLWLFFCKKVVVVIKACFLLVL